MVLPAPLSPRVREGWRSLGVRSAGRHAWRILAHPLLTTSVSTHLRGGRADLQAGLTHTAADATIYRRTEAAAFVGPGSQPGGHGRVCALVAQRTEQLPSKQWVTGSIPVGGATTSPAGGIPSALWSNGSKGRWASIVAATKSAVHLKVKRRRIQGAAAPGCWCRWMRTGASAGAVPVGQRH